MFNSDLWNIHLQVTPKISAILKWLFLCVRLWEVLHVANYFKLFPPPCISYCLGKRNLNSIFIGMTPADMDIERENDHNLNLWQEDYWSSIKKDPENMSKMSKKILSFINYTPVKMRKYSSSSESIQQNQYCNCKTKCHISFQASHSGWNLRFWFAF